MRSVYVSTNGCEPTQADAEKVRADVVRWGGRAVHSIAEADIAVFLGCSFTQQKEDETKSAILDLLEAERLQSLVVAGCYLSHYVDHPRAHFIPTAEVARHLHDTLALNRPVDEDIANHPTPVNEEAVPLVTISDGCYGSCTFCSIKSVRGRHRSRPMVEVMKEVKEAHARSGAVKLTGIEVAGYGLDLGESLGLLLRQLWDAMPTLNLELGSLNPKLLLKMKDADLATLADERLTGNVHLPLESASTRILREMCRGYSFDQYEMLWNKLRTLGVRRFSCDLIAGFPTETEAEHHQNVDFLATHPLEFAQLFFYEPRPGTEAASLPQVPRAVRMERCLDLVCEFTAAYCERKVIPAAAVVSGQVGAPLNTNLGLLADII